MKKLLFLCILLHSFIAKGQCDVSITGVDLNTYEVTVEVINSEGCTANGIGGVNGAVTMLQIGYHLPEPINPDNAIVDLMTLPNAPCSPQWVANGYNLGMNPTSFYPGWWYSPSVTVTFDSDLMGDGLITGDVVVIPLNPPGDYITYPSPTAECGDDLIDYWLSEGECIEFVVWQLNYGATWHVANGGWAENSNGWAPDPPTYQDQNCNNSWYTCRDENPGAPVANPDFCEDVIIGCEDPIACNYDINAEPGGICVYCYSPYELGDSLCNPIEGYWDWYISIFPNCPTTGCTDFMACNYDPEATIDDGSCAYCDEDLCDNVPPYCYGCTDPMALNYDEDSQINDGTCVYSIGPDLVPIEVIVTDQDCLDDNETHIFYFQLTVVNIGTEDVGEFCFTTFLSQNQWQCANTIDINPGDTVTFNGSFQADWVSGQSNYVELDFVEGLNGEQEIITGNNNLVFTMPELIECEITLGCMDECALNYNPDANEDDGGCEYYETIIDTVFIELPPDTLIQIVTEYFYDTTYIEIIDTLYITLPPDTVTITETEFVYDTTYIEVIDTLIVNITDTLYIELPPDTITITETEFIFITDTIYETEILYITDTLYITLIDTIIEYQFIEVDCATGLPCIDLPGIDECEPLTVYIPNAFTPNNDGWNDAWEIVLFPECWAEVDAKVYNRWGGLVWESTDPYNLIWEGGFNDGDYYVPDGVYYWTFNGRKAGSAYVEQLEGHVTIFR